MESPPLLSAGTTLSGRWFVVQSSWLVRAPLGRSLVSELFPSKEAFEADGGGAAEATHETFSQLDELLAPLA